MPNISVITICFNNPEDVIATSKSVDMQSVKPFEHLIIDGSTKPGIRNHLEQHPQPAYRKWICEPDKGIADAFNKGIRNAKGDIVVMLNSGDCFFDAATISTVTKVFEEDPSIQWLHGKYKILRGNAWVIIGKPFEKNKLYRGMRSISHQTMFVKKDLHNKQGLYNTAEKIGMDYDFLCRIADESFAFIDSALIIFAPEGTSSINYLQSLKDAKRIYEKYNTGGLKLRVWQFRLKTLYYLLHSPIGNLLYKIKSGLRLENI